MIQSSYFSAGDDRSAAPRFPAASRRYTQTRRTRVPLTMRRRRLPSRAVTLRTPTAVARVGSFMVRTPLRRVVQYERRRSRTAKDAAAAGPDRVHDDGGVRDDARSIDSRRVARSAASDAPGTVTEPPEAFRRTIEASFGKRLEDSAGPGSRREVTSQRRIERLDRGGGAVVSQAAGRLLLRGAADPAPQGELDPGLMGIGCSVEADSPETGAHEVGWLPRARASPRHDGEVLRGPPSRSTVDVLNVRTSTRVPAEARTFARVGFLADVTAPVAEGRR